jgi:hypothetical protein
VAFFRRQNSAARAGASQAEAIERFWSWWRAQGGQETAQAIAEGDSARMIGLLTGRLHAIDSGRAWELGPGTESEHILVVSPEGDPALRGVARRWRRAAPDVDKVWAYADSRPPASDPAGIILTVADTEIDVASALALARVSGAHLDVAVFHPAFVAMSDQERRLATFLLLDTVLGEVGVETWIGTIDVAAEPPFDPVPLTGLRSVVRELTARFTDDQGEPVWVLIQGTSSDGAQVLASAQIPLRPVSAPQFDTYAGLTVPFADRTPEGLPAEGSLTSLRRFEEHVNARLDGSGRIVGHETHQGIRVLHCYLDGTTPALEQLRVAVAGWDQGSVSIVTDSDPAWEHVRHLRS